jgi:hypothetical protein
MLANAARLLLGAIAVSCAADANAAGMDAYRWKYRPVMVFAPSADTPALAQQKRVVGAESGLLRDRDIVVVYVVGDDVSHVFGPAPGAGAAALRARYGVEKNAFAALLVGKDGGVKLRSAAALSGNRLAGLIDAMPMRQDEMRKTR